MSEFIIFYIYALLCVVIIVRLIFIVIFVWWGEGRIQLLCRWAGLENGLGYLDLGMGGGQK